MRPLGPLLLELLNSVPDANDQDREGRTPLALAVLLARRMDVIRCLLDHRGPYLAPLESLESDGSVGAKAKTEKKKEGGNKKGKKAAPLGPKTTDCEVPDKAGCTPLHHAVKLARVSH
jgi:hypothetical protein